MNKISHTVFIEGQLTYELLDSIWYDTASPAQRCISILRDTQKHIPEVRIVSSGKEYLIDSDETFRRWIKEVFSPTETSYQCDFSLYLYE